ncbi:MAG TPA: hypothetical protein VKK79_05585 [Candidatus Lokiarchaeia archaeon]|nr:hypothetical protein [Candidatus Lokiarchaeia archaeon]
MLYTVFIYESSSGILFWEHNFDPANTQQLDLFSSFFSAIKIFVQELVLNGQKQETLNNISMGTHFIILTSIKDLGIDLVFIADKEDENKIKKVTLNLIELLHQFKQLFVQPSDGNIDKYQVLDAPILAIFSKQKDLITKKQSLTDDHESIVRELFAKKGKLDPVEVHSLQSERDLLRQSASATSNLLVKHRILDQILKIEQRLADHEGFLSTSVQYRALTSEIEDLHYKLNYWLKETKASLRRVIDQISRTQKSLQDGDYKDAYRPLFDFATNLKRVVDPAIALRYTIMARTLIDKQRGSPDIFSQTIQEILNLNDDAFILVRTVNAG